MTTGEEGPVDIARAKVLVHYERDDAYWWECDCGSIGLYFPDEETAQADAWVHFERDHVAVEG